MSAGETRLMAAAGQGVFARHLFQVRGYPVSGWCGELGTRHRLLALGFRRRRPAASGKMERASMFVLDFGRVAPTLWRALTVWRFKATGLCGQGFWSVSRAPLEPFQKAVYAGGRFCLAGLSGARNSSFRRQTSPSVRSCSFPPTALFSRPFLHTPGNYRLIPLIPIPGVQLHRNSAVLSVS